MVLSVNGISNKFFSYSFKVDQELFPYDIQGTIAHVKMLGKVGLLKAKETRILVRGLEAVLKAHQDEPLGRLLLNTRMSIPSSISS
jgi:argininosuccinate lyase